MLVGWHQHLLTLLVDDQASFFENVFVLRYRPHPLTLPLEKGELLVPDVVHEEDEGLRRVISTDSATFCDESGLTFPQKGDELAFLEVAGAPDHEDGAVEE